MKKIIPILIIMAVILMSATFSSTYETSTVYEEGLGDYKFNNEGNLVRPEGYRKWIYIGTPVTPNDLNGGEAPFPEFHNVYIHPDDFEHWEKTGKFNDGTIMVKELVSVGSKKAVSGNGYFMGDFVGLEATIKDSKRFPDEPSNWAYFSFGHSLPYALTAKAFPTAACNSCHLASAADDFVFTQYYPVLSAAKGGDGVVKSGATAIVSSEALNTDAMRAALNGMTVDKAVVPPAEKVMLMNWLNGGYYTSWYSESKTHASTGPHTDVKVFYNSILEASMKAGNKNHPVGSTSVKEQHEANTHYGWSVSIKLQEESAYGDGWYWFESVDKTDITKVPFEGIGHQLCTGCHVRPGNKDLILSGYPLK